MAESTEDKALDRDPSSLGGRSKEPVDDIIPAKMPRPTRKKEAVDDVIPSKMPRPELPSFIDGAVVGKPSSKIAETVYLDMDNVTRSKLDELPAHLRKKYYKAKAFLEAQPNSKRKETGEEGRPGWTSLQENPIVTGALFKNWDRLERTIEKYTSVDFLDVPDYFDDEDSFVQDMAEWIGLFGSVALGLKAVSGAAGVVGLASLAELPVLSIGSRLVSPIARLAVKSPLIVTIGASSILKEGSQDGAPTNEYGGLIEVGRVLTGGGETEKGREEREKEYAMKTYGERVWSYTKSETIDEALGFLGFKAVAGTGKALLPKGIKRTFLSKAEKIRAFKEEQWAAAHGDVGSTLKDTEEAVRRHLADNMIRKEKNIEKVLELPGGEKVHIFYKNNFPDVSVEEFMKPTVVGQKAVARIGKDLVEPSPKSLGRRIYNLLDETDEVTDELVELTNAARAGLSKPGQKGPVQDTLPDVFERVAFKAQAKITKQIIDNGYVTDGVKKQAALLDRVIKEAPLESGLAGASRSASGKDLSRLNAIKEITDRMDRLQLTPETISGLRGTHKKFVLDLQEGLGKGTIDPSSVGIVTGFRKGGTLSTSLKSMLGHSERQIANNRLGTNALKVATVSNAAQTALGAYKNVTLRGLNTAARDGMEGLMNVLGGLKDGVTRKDGLVNMYKRLTGQATNEAMAARSLIQRAMPQTWAGKAANAASSWRFEAMNQIDTVTQAYNAPMMAREALTWATEESLRNVKNYTPEMFDKAYNKILASYSKSMRAGVDSEFLPLLMDISKEGMDKIAMRRTLDGQLYTPMAGKYFSKLYGWVDKMGSIDPIDATLLQSVRGFLTKSLLVPFARTGINVAEFTTYGAQGLLAPASKKLSQSANLDRKLVGELMGMGVTLYTMDTLFGSGVIEMDEPLLPSQDVTEARMSRLGIGDRKIKILGSDYAIKADALGAVGQGAVLTHMIHQVVNAFGEDVPELGTQAMNSAQKAFSVFGAGEVFSALEDFSKFFYWQADSPDEELLSTLGRAGEELAESSLPFSKEIKNIKEAKAGVKFARVDNIGTEKLKREEAVTTLENIYTWVMDRYKNAYGAYPKPARNYFGEPTRSIHYSEFNGDPETMTNQLIRQVMHGAQVSSKEENELYSQLSDMGFFDLSKKQVGIGGRDIGPAEEGSLQFTPPSRTIQVGTSVIDNQGRGRPGKVAVNLPTHKYELLKGLMGLKKDAWEDYLSGIRHPDKMRQGVMRKSALQVANKHKRDLIGFGYTEGDDLQDVIRTIAMWPIEERNRAPRALKAFLRATESSDLRYGLNEEMHVPDGISAEEHMFNIAKKRTIVQFYEATKYMARVMMSLDPQVQALGQGVRETLEGEEDGRVRR